MVCSADSSSKQMFKTRVTTNTCLMKRITFTMILLSSVTSARERALFGIDWCVCGGAGSTCDAYLCSRLLFYPALPSSFLQRSGDSRYRWYTVHNSHKRQKCIEIRMAMLARTNEQTRLNNDA